MNRTYVLYHDNCLDGFGAALAAYTIFGEEASYFPVNYQTEPPIIEANSDLYILDFSYDRPTLERLLAIHHQVVILDHHKTAAEALLGLQGALFDLNRSGAMITWQYFHPDAAIPKLFTYLQDRDLWRWQYPQTEAVTVALKAIGFDNLSAWLPYLQDENLTELEANGLAILQANRQTIQWQVKQSYLGCLPQSTEQIPLVNTSILVSETCHALLDEPQYADYNVVAAWYQVDNTVYYSLRSRSTVDCADIAKRYGGGGHPQASGFTWKLTELKE